MVAIDRRRPAPGRPAHRHSDAGTTIVDVIVALALVLILGGLAVPVTARAVEAGRARHAAGFLAAMFRDARQRAALEGRSTGLVFDETPSGWLIRRCTDGNANGLHRSEIDSRVDRCPGAPFRIADQFRDVQFAVDPTLRGPDGDPPSSDAVRLGRSDMASFSPDGNGTPGTVFLRAADGTQYCVRLGGISSRTRVLRYDPGTRTWSSP